MSRVINVLIQSLVASLFVTSLAHAGHVPPACEFSFAAVGGTAGGGNGGDGDELAFLNRLKKIDHFLMTEEGRKQFPEVDSNDLHTVVSNIGIYMKDVKGPEDEVRDIYGNIRTCAWSDTSCTITCNRARYHEHLRQFPNQAYQLPGHEVFAMMGVESGTVDVPSGYTVSSRLTGVIEALKQNAFVLHEPKDGTSGLHYSVSSKVDGVCIRQGFAYGVRGSVGSSLREKFSTQGQWFPDAVWGNESSLVIKKDGNIRKQEDHFWIEKITCLDK